MSYQSSLRCTAISNLDLLCDVGQGEMVYTDMITVISIAVNGQGSYTARLLGPRGMIEIRDLVWITDRSDILEIYYWESWAVLQGAYHCCLSIPGKVLLIEQ